MRKIGRILKWIILIIVILGIIGAVASAISDTKVKNVSKTDPQTTEGGTENVAADTEKQEKESDVTDEANAPNSEAPSDDATDPETSSDNAADSDSSLTMGQKNALSKAGQYLSITGFSHDGLIKQLEFEGFSTEEATYAADNCGADWNEQAAKKAEEYLAVTSFSKSGLIDQLKFEGFTDEQANYGATAVGY